MQGEPSDRRALQSVAVQFVTNGLVYATVVPRLPDIQHRVGVSIGTLGLILTLGSIAGLVATLLTSRVIPRFGSRRVMTAGGLVMACALPIIGFARTPWLLVVGLMLWLFLDVFVDVAMNIQGSALSARRHTPVMNRLHGFWSLGTVAGGVVSVGLLRAGVSTPVQLTATAFVLGATLAFIAPGLLRRDETHELETHELEAHELEMHEPGAAREPIGSARPPHRRLVTVTVLAAAGATAMAIEMVNGDWASFRLGEDLDARPGVAGLGFLVFTVGMMIGRLGGDFVQVRTGADRLVRAACIVIAAGTVLATLIPNIAVAVVGFLVAGLGTSVLFPQLYDRAARTAGPPGSGFAPMLLGQRGAAVVAPALIGALAATSVLGVGQSMAIVVLPCAAIIALTTFARL